jgi:hypothetical protein
MTSKPPRTPWVRILPHVARLFLKPAMFGWTVRAVCVAGMILTPLATASAWNATPPPFRLRLVAVAGVVEATALALYFLMGRLRAR